MFAWVKKLFGGKQKPEQKSVEFQVVSPNEIVAKYSKGAVTRTESLILTHVLADVLNQQNIALTNRGDRLLLDASGWTLQPEFAGAVGLQSGGLRTTTRIRLTHTKIAPTSVFEFQHAAGANLPASLRSGFESWRDMDLPVLLDAVSDTPTHCMKLEFKFHDAVTGRTRTRRGLLGPVSHMCMGGLGEKSKDNEHLASCQCCLLTNTMAVFKAHIERPDFVMIRFFASRDQNGCVESDCRVNGEDFEAGAKALEEYVTTWPDLGFEFRKQLVVLMSVDAPLAS